MESHRGDSSYEGTSGRRKGKGLNGARESKRMSSSQSMKARNLKLRVLENNRIGNSKRRRRHPKQRQKIEEETPKTEMGKEGLLCVTV